MVGEKAAVVNIGIKMAGEDVEANGLTVSGSGTALAAAMLEQDAAYWEIVVGQAGTIAAGVSQRQAKDALGATLGDGKASFGSLWGALELQAGDVLGVCLGLSDYPMLTYYLNGSLLDERAVDRVKGDVYPAVSVADGAEVTFLFTDFKQSPPSSRFDPVMIAREILRR